MCTALLAIGPVGLPNSKSMAKKRSTSAKPKPSNRPAASKSTEHPVSKAPRASKAKTAAVEAAAAKPSTSEPSPARPRARKGKPAIDLGHAVREAFATNERASQFLLEQLDPLLWQAAQPNTKPGTGRTIGAIVAHMHNVRHMWLTVSGKDLVECPEKLDRKTATIDDARAAMARSALAMDQLLVHALKAGGHVKDFKPDVVGFLSYAVSHEAHHRGQICLLARLLGHALPEQANFGLWDWRKRHAEIGTLVPLEPDGSQQDE